MADTPTDVGRVGCAETGSHATHEAPSGLRPSGFDPARWSKEWGDEFIAVTAKHLPQHFNGWWAKWGSTVRFWRTKSLARTAYEDGFEIGARSAFIALGQVEAIATEARRAETPKSGSVHEGAGRRHRPKSAAQKEGF